jgi:hypothetical protein
MASFTAEEGIRLSSIKVMIFFTSEIKSSTFLPLGSQSKSQMQYIVNGFSFPHPEDTIF